MDRRGNGEGSISWRKGRKDKLYVSRFYIETPDGNRTFKIIYGKTRSQRSVLG
jgi:hypothetical protein